MRLSKPIRIDGDVAFITLTKGYEAIVDVKDLEKVASHSWKASVRKRRDGSIYKVYAQRTTRVDGKCGVEMMHRAILKSELAIDHVNGNGLDNRSVNLRPATGTQNNMNKAKQASNTSGFKGVSWAKREKRWVAQTKKNGKNICLGYHKCAAAAHISYALYVKSAHPEFARLQ